MRLSGRSVMASADVRLAASPTSWGVDFADAPNNPPWPVVLDEIAQAGIGALELGPVGYLPEEPGQLAKGLRRRGLRAVGSFIFEDFHDPAHRGEVLRTARRACAAISAAGGTVVVIIDRPGRRRAATAGRSDVAIRLSRDRWRSMIDMMRDVASIAGEYRLSPAVHPHAGSYVEFADEIDALLVDSDLPLCLDTGHLAYAGEVPEEAVRRYGSRLGHLHLKDTARSVLERVKHDQQLGFWDAIAEGVFCPLGQGVVNLPAVAAALDFIDYCGYATIEQDRLPGSGAAPIADLQSSRRVLASAGIGNGSTGAAS